jgi:hypothetical protein
MIFSKRDGTDLGYVDKEAGTLAQSAEGLTWRYTLSIATRMLH